MLGIFLLLLNNHRKFVDTVNNISFTSQQYHKAKQKGNKYYHDKYGHQYDVSTGHMIERGYDKQTGHRGIIDTRTGRAIEDHIEMSMEKPAEEYMQNNFSKMKERLDARKECLSKPHKEREVLSYRVGKDRYVIYWDNETKHYVDSIHIDSSISNQSYLSYTPTKGKMLMDAGYSEEEIYEYYCWKGEIINYPLDIKDRARKKVFN